MERVVRVSRIRYLGRLCESVEIFSSGRIVLIRADSETEHDYADVHFSKGHAVVVFYSEGSRDPRGLIEALNAAIQVKFLETVPQEVR